ncbi:MAG: peptidase T [Blautia sp.]|nr:peptidase T [Blautia sp.]MDY5031240.1 peptidase T [Blautia sp.]
MRAYERLLNYITYDTASDETVEKTPTTEGQRVLAEALAEEMKQLGLSQVAVDEHAYVYGKIPAKGVEGRTPFGFIAHLDTVSEFPAHPVKPQIIRDYDGESVVLGDSGRVLTPEKFPHLREMKGKTLITTDGTTILGADDKAGVAEIMTMCEQVLASEQPHGEICICFTPDEETGHGAALLDLERFGAKFAYTVDGSAPEVIEYETFHAAGAKWEIRGFETHPGSAKDVMINASLVAAEIIHMLPEDEIPAKTEGYQGFFHLCSMEGNVSRAGLDYIIRDHDAGKFARRKEQMEEIEKRINEKYGEGTAKLTIWDEYRNMAEVLKDCPEVIQMAKDAAAAVGLTPVTEPVRGGTDGSQLSFRGLPCPNLGTGGYAYHGPYEHAVAEQMDQAVEILKELVYRM